MKKNKKYHKNDDKIVKIESTEDCDNDYVEFKEEDYLDDSAIVEKNDRLSHYYIIRSDYKHYKKGEIISDKKEMDHFKDNDLHKVIVVKKIRT